MVEYNCRHCRAVLSETVIDLGVAPLSNSFLSSAQLENMEPFYPLKALVCSHCFLVQLIDYESPSNIFTEEYAYFSSYSESWLSHARSYVGMMTRRFGLGQESKVVEIASNDGYLLQYFVEDGIPVLGIEPAGNCATVAIKKGVETIIEFFSASLAASLADQGIKADLLLGNNVLAHTPDLNDFVAGLPIILKKTGVITMEFPHLLRLFEKNQYDTIYHEHYSYLSLTIVEKIFREVQLTIFDVEELETHGGSIRIFARHTDTHGPQITSNVSRVMLSEREYGLDKIETYRDFKKRVEEHKLAVLEFFIEAKRNGKQIVGYGAPAKGNILLNYCGIRTDFIDYTVDKNTYKQGMFLPGVHIPVVAPERIYETKPDYVVILPWNIKEEIMRQMADIRSWGGRFVTLSPKVEVNE